MDQREQAIVETYLERFPDDLALLATIMAYVGLRDTIRVLREAKGRRIEIVKNMGHTEGLRMRYV